jgi:hypothetical protein
MKMGNKGGKTRKMRKRKSHISRTSTSKYHADEKDVDSSTEGADLIVRNFKSMNCNPVVDDKTAVKGSCYTEDALNEIKDAYNDSHEREIHITATDPKYIWLELRKRLTDCKAEDCWLSLIKNPDTRRKLDNIMFAPDQPNEWNQDPIAWLSNYDIAAVLRQYEKSHTHFKLLGPTAIDYDTRLGDGKCVWNDLCKLSLSELMADGKRKLGVVFNLDKHYQSGSHWVSMFVDLDRHVIFYYDSAVNPVPREVSRLKNEIIRQGKALDTPIRFNYIQNDYSHQTTNTECGMYCLFFIITWLTEEIDRRVASKHASKITGGKTKRLTIDDLIKLFTQPGINDNMMIEYRRIFFNKK